MQESLDQVCQNKNKKERHLEKKKHVRTQANFEKNRGGEKKEEVPKKKMWRGKETNFWNAHYVLFCPLRCYN